MVRRPAVAGYFYPAAALELQRDVEDLTRVRALPAAAPQAAHAVIVPHGSYRHAGSMIGQTLASVAVPRRCIILGPSHTGSWMSWSLMSDGAYRTPLGDVPIDTACASGLQARCPFLASDAWAQRGEHAIEVLVPFLQRLGPEDLSLVPVITSSSEEAEFAQLATALAQVVRLQEEPVLLIASTDLSHYTSVALGAAYDHALLRCLCDVDGPALRQAVKAQAIRMCGDQVAACVADAARELGARRGRVIAYGTSADAGGDPDSVTGYAGVLIE